MCRRNKYTVHYVATQEEEEKGGCTRKYQLAALHRLYEYRSVILHSYATCNAGLFKIIILYIPDMMCTARVIIREGRIYLYDSLMRPVLHKY